MGTRESLCEIGFTMLKLISQIRFH